MLTQAKAFSSFTASDLHAVKQFYSEVIGVRVTEQKEGLVLHPGGGGPVFIYQKPDHIPASFTVLNFLVDDIDRTVAELKKRAVLFEHYTMPKTDALGISRDPSGPAVAWFKDPAGNILSVVQNQPGTHSTL